MLLKVENQCSRILNTVLLIQNVLKGMRLHWGGNESIEWTQFKSVKIDLNCNYQLPKYYKFIELAAVSGMYELWLIRL